MGYQCLAVSFILYPSSAVTIPCTCLNSLHGNMVIVASGGAFDTIVIMIQGRVINLCANHLLCYVLCVCVCRC